MSISDGLGPYILHPEKEKTLHMREDMDGKVFLSRQSRLFSFLVNMIKVLLPICTLTSPAKNYVSSQGKGINRRNEGNIINIFFGFDTL